MPIDNPKQVNPAKYYVDERNQLCGPCAVRLGFTEDADKPDEMGPPILTQPVHCTECQAFAAGVHPDLPKSIPSPETQVDNCPVCGGSRKLVHHASCSRTDLH